MEKSILLLRLSYWVAAIADFVIAILAWMPERMGLEEIAYPMGLFSVVAFSWTIMLLMADRKPIERKWVLVPTIVVVTLIATVRVIFSLGEAIELNWTLLLFAVALIVLMTYSYVHASKHETSR